MSELLNEKMSLESYLAQGGKLTSPENVSPRYRAQIMRMMASFIDSELAGSAGFADSINSGPGIKERIAASRITLEKLDHAERVLVLLGQFGANTERYFSHHPWTMRLPRDSDIGNDRHGQDMRLNVFHYPIEGWTDAVVMNVLMGKAVNLQLKENIRMSYQPLADVYREILPRERRHEELGIEGLRKILQKGTGKDGVEQSVAYWYPRIAASFGTSGSQRFDQLKKFGLRHTPNEELHSQWERNVADLLSELNLSY
ncbi:MAG: Phenylacetic acid catabolic protein [Granulosicoccus sp.]